MPDVKVPLLGNVPKGALFAGALAAVGVGGYLLYRKSKQNTTATSTGYGYGATAYGYGESSPGYYGYNYAYGGYGTAGMGAGITPYPTGEEYGYGVYGYGYYNPYTGQYLGGGTGLGSTGVIPPISVPPIVKTGGGGGSSGGGSGKPPTTHTITANGKDSMQRTANNNHITRTELLILNPHLGYLWGSGKPIPRGTRVKV